MASYLREAKRSLAAVSSENTGPWNKMLGMIIVLNVILAIIITEKLSHMCWCKMYYFELINEGEYTYGYSDYSHIANNKACDILWFKLAIPFYFVASYRSTG